MQKTALVTAGIIFTLLAISHFIRWLYAVEVLADGKILPVVAYIFACFFSFTSYLDVFCSKENETDFKPYKIRREGSFVSGFK